MRGQGGGCRCQDGQCGMAQQSPFSARPRYCVRQHSSTGERHRARTATTRHHRPGQRPTFDATRRRWTSKAPREPSSRSREPQPRATRAIESYYQRATRWSFLGSTVPRRRGPTPRGIQSHGLVKRSKSLLRVPCLAAVISDPKPPPLPLPPPILRFTAMSVCN